MLAFFIFSLGDFSNRAYQRISGVVRAFGFSIKIGDDFFDNFLTKVGLEFSSRLS
jgi:hypothetical protein